MASPSRPPGRDRGAGRVARRAALALLAGAGLAACGFSPVYGPGGPLENLRGQIEAAAPEDRASFVFVQRIEDRLGLPVSAPFLLSYDIDLARRGVGITPEGATTRYNVVGRVDYTLTDRATGRVLSRGKAENFTGYSATGSIVGTISSAEDATARLMVILADQLVTELVATAPDWRR